MPSSKNASTRTQTATTAKNTQPIRIAKVNHPKIVNISIVTPLDLRPKYNLCIPNELKKNQIR